MKKGHNPKKSKKDFKISLFFVLLIALLFLAALSLLKFYYKDSTLNSPIDEQIYFSPNNPVSIKEVYLNLVNPDINSDRKKDYFLYYPQTLIYSHPRTSKAFSSSQSFRPVLYYGDADNLKMTINSIVNEKKLKGSDWSVRLTCENCLIEDKKGKEVQILTQYLGSGTGNLEAGNRPPMNFFIGPVKEASKCGSYGQIKLELLDKDVVVESRIYELLVVGQEKCSEEGIHPSKDEKFELIGIIGRDVRFDKEEGIYGLKSYGDPKTFYIIFKAKENINKVFLEENYKFSYDSCNGCWGADSIGWKIPKQGFWKSKEISKGNYFMASFTIYSTPVGKKECKEGSYSFNLKKGEEVVLSETIDFLKDYNYCESYAD
jgi:hypothetical protein